MSTTTITDEQGPEVLLTRRDGIGIVTLNRPRKRNPLTHTLSDAFLSVLDEAERDRDLRALVVTGAGSVFCSGAELGTLVKPEGVEDLEWQFVAVRSHCRMVQRIKELDLPVIAAVNGPAIGGGVALALCCDLVLAVPEVKYHFAFGRIGLGAWDMACTYHLPKLVGAMRANEWLLTSAIVEGEEGKKAGLFLDLVPADQLLDRAVELGRKIADGAPRRAVAATKLSLVRAADIDLGSCLAYEAYTQNYMFQRAEHKEMLSNLMNNLRKK
jgi:enoyl-CoA hydratase/carnithine racemase